MPRRVSKVLFIFLVHLTPIPVFAQPCVPNSIYLVTQSQVDSFPINHPNCTEIEGELYIGYLNQPSDIENLVGLSQLEKVNHLKIIGADSLINLSGLNNIHIVAGNLEIQYCNRLQNLIGLEGLDTIEGRLIIEWNGGLISLFGLYNVKTAGEIEISRNSNIIRLDAFQNLEYIGGVYGSGLKIHTTALQNIDELEKLTEIDGYISITYNNNLESVEGLKNASLGAGDISITNNPSLTEINTVLDIDTVYGSLKIVENGITGILGLSNISSVLGDVWIQDNVHLQSLWGLHNLEKISGNFRLTSSKVNDLSELESLSYIGENLLIKDAYSLGSINGLNSIDTIRGYLYLQSLPAFKRINGFKNLRSVQGTLSLYNCDNLNNFSGFDSLSYIGGLNVERNYRIYDLEGLNFVDTIGGAFVIHDCSHISSLAGLKSLAYVDGVIYIWDNDRLESLDGLEGLSSTNDRIILSSNKILRDISALIGLHEISGDIVITTNDSLESLHGLDNIDPKTIESLGIYYNSSLTTCEVESVCQFLINSLGEVNISENAEGCQNESEVEEACLTVKIPKPLCNTEIKLHPNPANDVIHLSLPENIVLEEVLIHNSTGQTLFVTQSKKTLNISDLNPGLYILEIQTDKGVFQSKFLKK
jgi:hypothetical protein